MRRNPRRLVWSGVFLVLLVLSFDFWAWSRPVRLGPFGLPGWTMYFVLLQVILAGAAYAFRRRAWGALDHEDRDDPDLSEGPDT